MNISLSPSVSSPPALGWSGQSQQTSSAVKSGIDHKVSLAGKPPPVVDGFSGEQRLFLGFAQIWRTKIAKRRAVRGLSGATFIMAPPPTTPAEPPGKHA